MVSRYIGKPVRRVEDLRLITGNGRYTDDIGTDSHALEVAFVRSPHAHARIGDIDVTDALDIEGVVAIYTYEDLEGPGGGTAAGADPAPEPARAADRVRAGQGHGQPCRRADRHGGGREPLPGRRCRCPNQSSNTTLLPAVVGIPAAQGSENAVHEDIPDNIAAHLSNRSAMSTPRCRRRRTGWNST